MVCPNRQADLVFGFLVQFFGGIRSTQPAMLLTLVL